MNLGSLLCLPPVSPQENWDDSSVSLCPALRGLYTCDSALFTKPSPQPPMVELGYYEYLSDSKTTLPGSFKS